MMKYAEPRGSQRRSAPDYRAISRGFAWLIMLGTCGRLIAMEADVSQLAEHLGTSPALVVAVCGEEASSVEMVQQLVERSPWTVFCRHASASCLEILRDWARDSGQLGRRVYVIDNTAWSLGLADGMADAVWVAPDVSNPPSEQEIMRVLHPGGIHLSKGRVSIKPADADVDEWRHPYHGPDNNLVSQDLLARLPGELRFQTQPVFAAMPNPSLFAGGRIFFFTGHIAFHEREEPLINTLTVLNAYNGLRLWSRSLDPSCVVHNFTKLATEHEIVYAEGGTLRFLDAATGQTRSEHAVPADAIAAGDTDWKWIAQDGDRLWAAFGPPDGHVVPYRLKRQMGHWPWDVADSQYRVIVDNFGAARRLAAFTYPEMRPLWSVHESKSFDVRALCMEGGRIFLLAPKSYAAARDCSNGSELWRRESATSGNLLDAIGEALKRQGWGLGWATYCCASAHDGVLCIAGPPFKKTIGIDLAKGELLWTKEVESPHSFFLNNSLYIVPRVANPQAACETIDPTTGQVRGEFGLGVIGSCSRLTVTPHQFFYRPGGGEGRTFCFDLATRQLIDYEGVVRPGCFDGVVPANGRLYWMPLACDCWQVHGTFAMAPRVPLETGAKDPANSPAWTTPAAPVPAARDDWPAYRADAAGTATVPVSIPRKVQQRWLQRLPAGELTAPICAGGRVFVGGADGTVYAMTADEGEVLWRFSTNAALQFPPAYWNGRVVVGSCDGLLYCLNAADGKRLGQLALAPTVRYVNIMSQFMSAWPVGGGVVVRDDGVVFAAAGSTSADGAVVAAVDIATGKSLWRQTYTRDRTEPRLSFGLQGNLLLKDNRLFVNGGAPTGIVALDASTGGDPQVVARLEAGREMFLDPDSVPWCTGPELYANESARTTIFKRHQGRAYFSLADRWVALIEGRLFCARDARSLDRIVDRMNKDPATGGTPAVAAAPLTATQIPADETILWASPTADVCGLAVGTDGLVVLHSDCIEGLATDGQSLWSVAVPAAPVRWGVALTGRGCVVTLADGQLICLTGAE